MRFSRRALLGACGAGGGAYLVNPLLRTVVRQAEGATRKSLVLFTSGNGIDTKRYTMPSGAPLEFSASNKPREIFEPLYPFLPKLTIVDRLYNPHGLDLHGNTSATWTVQPTADDKTFAGISFDRHVANKIGGSDAISSLHLMGYGMDRAKHIGRSADGANKPYPYEWIPALAFQKTFGGVSAGGDEEAAKAAALRQAQKKSVLDALAGRIGTMKTRVGGEERQKLDQMLESVRVLEQRIDAAGMVNASCANPFALSGSGMPKPGDKYGEYYADSQVSQPAMEAMVDIAAHAIKCGLTRVALIILSEGSPHNKFPGIAGGHHSLCHDEKNSADKIAQIDKFHCALVARMAKTLEQAPGGSGGSLLDDSAVVWMSEGGGGHHGGSYDHPLIVVGRAGGALNTGRYIKLPITAVANGDPRASGTPGDSNKIPKVGAMRPQHCVSDAFVALANAVGATTEKFGDPQHCRGPLQELLS